MNQPFHMTVDAKTRRIVVRAGLLGSDGNWQIARELVARMLTSPLVESICLDRRTGTASIALEETNAVVSEAVRSLANDLRNASEPRFQLADVYAGCSQLKLQKVGGAVTAGSIVASIPGRVRIHHPLLPRHPETVRRVEAALAKVPGISSVAGSSLTGTVRILFRHGTITPQKLLAAIERMVNQSEDAAMALASPPVGQWVAAGTCLGLAIGAVPLPVLGPVAAAALVCSNLPTLSRGIVELCTFRWKVSSLYTVIMGTTLVSGQFLAAAIMQALVTGWHAWTNHKLRKVVHELNALPEPSPEIQNLILPDDSPSVKRRFGPGQTIHVPQGTVLPVDGIVVNGEADLDEHGVHGIPIPAHRARGDLVFAGSVVLRGDLQVKVQATGVNTRLHRIRGTVHSLICQTIGSGGATPRGKAVASRFVPYTFATGAAALMVGDLTTLAAVLRPDFSTGPSLTDRLGALTSISHLLHEGWLVHSCDSLHALARARTMVVFHPSVTDMDVCVSPLKSLSHPIEVHDLTGTEADCVDYVRFLCETERHVAVVANHAVLKQLAKDSVVRISLTPELCLGQPHVDLIALHGQPQKLGDLLKVLQESHRSGHSAWAAVLACNGLAISGAFLLGLTNLHVIAITNAGILAAGVLHERRMRRSNALLKSHSLQKALPAPESFALVPEEASPPVVEIDDPALQPVVVRHGPEWTSAATVHRTPPETSAEVRAAKSRLLPVH